VFNWDDALDVWGVHGMGGFLGSVMLGALADEEIGGMKRSGEFFGKQASAEREGEPEGLQAAARPRGIGERSSSRAVHRSLSLFVVDTLSAGDQLGRRRSGGGWSPADRTARRARRRRG
jgi:hypothetical protein